jgi:hypothetical protein
MPTMADWRGRVIEYQIDLRLDGMLSQIPGIKQIRID